MPLLDGPVDDPVIKHLQLFNQTCHEAGAIHVLLQYAPDVTINRIKIRAVGLW